MVTTLLVILVLLILSGFFSGSETALTAASRPRMHQLEKQGDQKAALVNRLRVQSEELIGTILVGNNLVNILASSLATSAMITLFGEHGVALATLVMTALVLIFSEVLPKTFAISDPDRVALMAAPLIRFFVVIFKPITWVVSKISLFLIRMLRLHKGSIGQTVGDEELRGAIELHQGIDDDTKTEREMLRSILDLADVDISEIMIHRKNVQMIDASIPMPQIIEQVLDSNFTRLPIWQNEQDNIIGILHARDLLKAIQAAEGKSEKIELASILRAPWFVPETTDLLDQLQAFRQRREHFAIVVDEYGVFEGIVTLEDILEEIVGDITDEHDDVMAQIQKTADGSYLIPGYITIRDLNREFEWGLPDEEAATLAGFLLHESRVIPDTHQVFSFYGFRFEVVKKQRHQLLMIKVRPPRSSQAQKD